MFSHKDLTEITDYYIISNYCFIMCRLLFTILNPNAVFVFRTGRKKVLLHGECIALSELIEFVPVQKEVF